MENLIDEVLKELQERQNAFENPGLYQETEWYEKCRAKAEAFEEAIDIVKKHFLIKD